MKIHFLYLTAFSLTGGIESFNKAFFKAVTEIIKGKSISFKVISAYDTECDNNYIQCGEFKGYGSNRIIFTFSSLKEARNSDIVFPGHINLSLVGLLLNLINKNIKVVIVAHGTDVWENVSFVKKLMLKKCYRILAVSNYTRLRIEELIKINPEKIIVFHNTIDPYFVIPKKFEKPEYLFNRYEINSSDKVILTISRMRFSEKYKGYDKVIETLPDVIGRVGNIKYIIAGSYDKMERERIENLISKYSLEKNVVITGFIKDEELEDHYLLSDLFIMPSKGEGFGIVFIEALSCGLPVIAGNKDGSVDALKNGELGNLVDPDNKDEIKEAIIKTLNAELDKGLIQQRVIQEFGFENFKKNLEQILMNFGWH